MKKQNQGVTLIALVITIIVLLILAGVSMNVMFGDNNLFEKAQQAKEQTQNAVQRENDELGKIIGYLDNGYIGGAVRNGSWNGTVNTPKTDGTGLKPVYWNGTTWVELTNESSQTETSSEYVTLYTGNNLKGDATNEISTSDTGSTSWNGDYSYFIKNSSPVYYRGGDFGNTTVAGMFSFFYIGGAPY